MANNKKITRFAVAKKLRKSPHYHHTVTLLRNEREIIRYKRRQREQKALTGLVQRLKEQKRLERLPLELLREVFPPTWTLSNNWFQGKTYKVWFEWNQQI